MSHSFESLVEDIPSIGKNWHTNTLIQNAARNSSLIKKTTKNLDVESDFEKGDSCIVISAGPSLHKFDLLKKIKESNYKGTLICVDGSYVKCLKAGITPDYMLTLDPHPTRIVRWFGDPDFEKNTAGDDYFSRQDLDVDFRNNSIKENLNNIDLINNNASNTKLIISTSAPENVVSRSIEAGFDMYWWNPLVDDPNDPDSLTRKLYAEAKAPCMNTGGTVGTAAWVFANSILKFPKICVIGMDLGYHMDTPIEMTQTFYELQEFISKDQESFKDLFPEFSFPLTGEKFYTDPTYYWYRKNFLELVDKSTSQTFNCSQAGTLFNENIACTYLEDFIKENS